MAGADMTPDLTPEQWRAALAASQQQVADMAAAQEEFLRVFSHDLRAPLRHITSYGKLVREVFLNGSVVLLLGAFAIGLVLGPDRYQPIAPVFTTGFTGLLCLFLLDMGLVAMRRLRESRALSWRMAALGLVLPLINGTIGLMLAMVLGLDAGTGAPLAMLAASASYIAVPAAIRLAMPDADPGIYLTMSLSITFPFNILFGIGIVSWMARALAGA